MNLLAYIQGKRKGKEAHRIERDAMRDPFLADALEGFDSIEGDHVERIAGIRMRLSVRERKSSRKIIYVGLAASLFLCVSIGGYFLMNKSEQRLIAQSELSEEKKTEEILLPERKMEEDEQVADEGLDRQDERSRSAIVASEDNSSLPVSPPVQDDPSVQDDLITITDDVITEDAETMYLPEVAAVDIPQDKEDSFIIAQAEARQPARLNTQSDEGQRTMASPATDKKPEPKIGMKAYRKYLKDSMIRPESGECAKRKGGVIVEFKIDAEGHPHHIELRKKLCEDLDKEAIRLIENGPVWAGDSSKRVVLEVKF